MDLQFVTKVNNMGICGINEHFKLPNGIDVDVEAECTVYWHVYMEAREWGIKSFDTIVDKVTINMQLSVYNEELTKVDIDTLKQAGAVLYRNDKWEWEADIVFSADNIECDIEIAGCICPSQADADFSTGKVSVS